MRIQGAEAMIGISGSMRLIAGIALAAIPVQASLGQHDVHDEVQTRLESIESRIDELSHENDALAVTRHNEIAAIVRDVLTDAETRASFQDQGLTAGHDGGFFVDSADGNFHLDLSGFIQFRHVWNNREDSGGDDSMAGFGNRRVRLKFQGHVVDPSWQYVIGISFSRSTGTAGLSDAWIEKDLGNGWSFRAGNFKQPFQREWLMSAKRLQLAERSFLVGAFSLSRLPGLQLSGETDSTSWSFAVQDLDPTAFVSEGYVLTARGEWQVSGPRRTVRDYSSFPGTDPATSVGAAIAWLDQSFVDPAVEDVNVLRWTADLQMEFDGRNLVLGVIGNHIDGTLMPDMDQYAAFVQGGVFLTEDTELVGRFTWGDADDGTDELQVIELGVVRYFDRNDLKLTCDIGYGLNPITGIWPSSGGGWRADAPGEDGQFVIRTQLQLVF